MAHIECRVQGSGVRVLALRIRLQGIIGLTYGYGLGCRNKGLGFGL